MRRFDRHEMGAAAAVVVLFAALLSSTTALGQPSDYEIESTSWNGLSKFLQTGRTIDIEFDVRDELEYGELKATDALIVVYPRNELEVDALSEFIVDGGRVLLADDFGASASFLERLDIERLGTSNGDVPHEEFARDNRSLPIFKPTGVHPLLEGVGTVVANHPVVLEHHGGPVVPYGERGGIVYDMNLGEGKVIVFGDASLLINQMLEVADNRRLVRNALEYICRDAPNCRPQLYVGEFEQSGSYGGSPESANPVQWFAERFNRAVATLQEAIPSDPLLFYLAVILTGGLALYLATVFSVRKSRRYSEYVEEALADVPVPQSEFEWNLSRFGADRRETNFALPLSILKEIFEELFLKELGYWKQEPGERPSVPELAREFREQCLGGRHPEQKDQIEREVRDLLATYARIPTRHRVFLDSDAYFSDRDLIKLYRRTMRTLELMGLKEEYERRTRTLV